MAKQPGRIANFQITDAGGVLRDVSTDLDSVDGLPGTMDIFEVTGLGATSKEWLTGLKDATVALKGTMSDTVNTSLYTVSTGIWGVSKAMQYGPAGTAVGKPKLTFNGIVFDIKLTTAVTGKGVLTVSVRVSGDVAFGTF